MSSSLLFMIIITVLMSATAYGGRSSNISIDPQLVEAEAGAKVISVIKDGRGQFETVTDALNSIPEWSNTRWIVCIGRGEYWEKITIQKSKPFVTLYAKPWDMPVIVFNGTAADFGTWNSATFAVESDNFVAVNIVFKNSAPEPDGKRIGAQAVAMRISGDKAAFYGCKFIGFQDTLCDDHGRHFFHKCHIQGTIDFIFGDGRSIYQETTIESVAKKRGVMTAQGRDSVYDNSGYVFLKCKFTGSGKMQLGRAWRKWSRVVVADSYMDSVVDPAGWSDFGDPDSDQTVYYGEYKNEGPGADMTNRVKYARMLSDEEANQFVTSDFIDAKTWLLPPP
ncbi:hypothetical protein QQ045_031857 [Rhodiola kirilowii]